MTGRMGKSGWLVAVMLVLGACGGGEDGIRHRQVTDALYAVMEADRQAYTERIVQRLANEEKVIGASEHWKDDRALALPAQMFRFGSERVAEKDAGFRYALISPWPINTQNAARTEAEKSGIEALGEDPETPFYATETLAGVDYFTALYPDRAVSAACVDCHNGHPDSPRDDFEKGDVMGAVVIRLPLDRWGG